jgi:hypothetical protein
MDRHLPDRGLSPHCEQRLADVGAIAGGRSRRGVPEFVVFV